MLGEIGSYVIAFAVLAGIKLPFAPLTMRLSGLLRGAKRVSPVAFAVFDAVKIYLAVLLASWLIHRLGETPAWLMFLIPGYFMVRNGLMRTKRVKAGRSKVKLLLERSGEPESYDQTLDLWTERGHLTGDVIGWIVGAATVLRSAAIL